MSKSKHDEPDRSDLGHGGWNPWTEEMPREAVERSLEWVAEVLRSEGKTLATSSTD